PQPPNTSQKVPNNSATARFAMGMTSSPYCYRAASCTSAARRQSGKRSYGRSVAGRSAGFRRWGVDFRDPLVDGLLGAHVGQIVGSHDMQGHEPAVLDLEGVGAPAALAGLE